MKNLILLFFVLATLSLAAQPPNSVVIKVGTPFTLTGQPSNYCSDLVNGCVNCTSDTHGQTRVYNEFGFEFSSTGYWPSGGFGSIANFTFTIGGAATYTVKYQEREVNLHHEVFLDCTKSPLSPTLVKDITVYAETDLQFTLASSTICANDAPINLLPRTNKSSGQLPVKFFVDGVELAGSMFNPGLYSSGSHTIRAEYNFYNGMSSVSRAITINPAPSLNFTLPAQICSDGTDVNLNSLTSVTGGTVSFSCVGGTCGGAMFYTSGSNTMLNLDWNGTSSSFSSTIRATATSPQGCVTTVDRVLQTGMAFTINPGSNFSVCKNGTTVALGGTNTAGGGSTVGWSGTGVSGTNFNPGDGSVVAGNNYTLTYSVNNNTGCLKTATKVVTVNPAPVLSLTTSSATRCNNTTVNLNTVYGPRDGGSSITNVTWSSSNSTINTRINNTTKLLDLSGVAGGSYPLSYSFTNASGCTSSATVSNAITVNSTPGLPTISTNPANPSCGATNFALTGGGASGGEEYRWYNASNTLQGTGSNFSTGALAVGSYTYKATRRNTTTGCESDYQTINLTINNLPVINSPAAGQVFNECTGTGTLNLFTLTGANPTGGTFSSSNSTISSRLSGTGNAVLNLSGVVVGNYPVTYTVTSGCSASVNFNLNFSSGVAIPAVADKVNCAAGQSASLTVSNIDGAAIYRWYESSSGGNVVHTGTSFTTPPLNSSKSYWIEATKGTCVSPRDQATVIVVDFGEVNAGTDLGACTNAVSFNLNDGSNSPAGGVWSGPGVTGNTFNGSGLSVGQTYTITYTYTQSGCSGSDTRNISLGLTASLTATPGTTVDFGEKVEINHNYSNATETRWDFGDGWTLNQLNGVHYYYSEGPKTIKVYIKVNQGGLICDGDFTFNNFITVNPLDVITQTDNPLTAIKEVKAFPIPFSNSLNVYAEMEVGEVEIRLVDTQGKPIVNRMVYLSAGNNEVISVSEGEGLPQGMYILLIQQNKLVQPIKIIKR